MNIDDIGNINLNDLKGLISKAESLAKKEMGNLSDSDKLKLDELLKDIDTNDVSSIKSKIQDLNNIKDAKN